MQPCQKNSRSFFEKLQNAEGLDLCDNRGKRHDLAVVLVGVTIALLAKGVRTLTTIILSQTNCQNKKAQLENFSDDFSSLIVTLKILNFL